MAKALLKHLISSSPKPPVSRFFSTAENRTQKLERIADELLDLTKLELYDYSILFRLKLGLNRYGPAVSGATSAAASAAGAETKAAEKTAFDIKLEKYEAGAKIKIIKEVRAFTELGLKEAKELVEKVPVGSDERGCGRHYKETPRIGCYCGTRMIPFPSWLAVDS
ncbi:hypothetical protein GQ457_09G010900 [Hibiscus cannabinus]